VGVGVESAAQGPWVERAARFGLVAKGLLYLLVAVIAVRVALGGGGEPEDRDGALRALADEPGGFALILALAAGLAAYALWRLAEAVFDTSDKGDDPKGLAKRGGSLVRAGWYAVLAWLSVSVLFGQGESSSNGDERDAVSGVLDMPLGRWLVGGVGLGILGAGLWNGWRAARGKYRKDMKTGEMNRAGRRWLDAMGVAGHLSRALVFSLIGIFVVRAAWQFDPKEAIGLDGALEKLAGQELGTLWLGLAAAGLGAYGVFCLIQARYRDV
jgi:hypothetical protein